MKYYFLSLLGIIFYSCNSTDEDISMNPQTQADIEIKHLPSKLTSSEKTTHFYYDNQDRLIRFEEKSTENLYSKEFSISYKDNLVNEIILKYESSDSYSYTNLYTFEYIEDNVVITNLFTDINDYSVTQSRTIRIDMSNFLTSGFGIKTTYDNKKNLLEIIEDNTGTKNKFDNKNAIYKNVNSPQWLLYYVLKLGIHKENNPLEIHTIRTDRTETNSSVISYEYNSEDFPVKQFITDDNYYTTETQIEYLTK